VFTPHIVQIDIEAAAAITTNPIAADTFAFTLPLIAECVQLGCRTELWLTANGNAPAVTAFAGTNAAMAAAFEPNQFFPMTSNQ
jgi:hypothetical protein